MIMQIVQGFLYFCAGIFLHMSVLHFFFFEETARHPMIRMWKSRGLASALWGCVQLGSGLAILLFSGYRFGPDMDTLLIFLGFCAWGIVHGLWADKREKANQSRNQ
jgi:hypothetical protein